jgi:hypothetical protein
VNSTSARLPRLVIALGLVATGCSRSSAAAPTRSAGSVASPATTTTAGSPPTTAPAPAPAPAPTAYPVHTVTATVFWVGEPADSESGYISNTASAWDDHWRDHFGGLDDPDHRAGWRPAAFTPRENPFYVALPYDDLDDDDHVKASAAGIPGTAERVDGQSVLKNRWVRIERDGRVAYAQWEDVGPFRSDDFGYVFGTAAPANRRNDRAGIDVSPAVRDQLALDGEDTVSWRFVDRADVPAGPWLSVVTISGVGH